MVFYTLNGLMSIFFSFFVILFIVILFYLFILFKLLIGMMARGSQLFFPWHFWVTNLVLF